MGRAPVNNLAPPPPPLLVVVSTPRPGVFEGHTRAHGH